MHTYVQVGPAPEQLVLSAETATPVTPMGQSASHVTLKQSQLVVHKATAMLPITIIRTGECGSPLSVTLSIKEGSATFGRDYLG